MSLFDPSTLLAEEIEPLEDDAILVAHSGPRRRVAFGLSYDGSRFHGFAPQPGQRTVAGVFCEALSPLVGGENCVCAGRTDVGVHATGQVVHVDCDEDLLTTRFAGDPAPGKEIESLRRALGAKLRPEIAIWRAVVVPENFDARRSATARRYRYLIDTDERSAPLRRHIAWQLGRPLDLSLLRLATDALIGEHDFSPFCRRPADRPDASLVRRVLDATWHSGGPDRLVFEIEANAFCHQMVRAIVGTLVSVGAGQLRPSDVVAALRRGGRDAMPAVAPACGLCLVKVTYPPEFSRYWR